MGFATETVRRPVSDAFFGLLTLGVVFLLCVDVHAVAAPSDNDTCRQKLSKKGVMIFDEVQRKLTPTSNLEDTWKEVTRDLITSNTLGREEATAPALEALSCLHVRD